MILNFEKLPKISDDTGVINDDNNLPFRTCFTCQWNYYRTFDGREYIFEGVCRYSLAKMVGEWEIQVEMHNCDKYETCKKVHDYLFSCVC